MNVFGIKGECKRLPNCFIDMVQKQYPNPKGEFFTGYKSKADRTVGPRKQSLSKKRALDDSTNNL